MAEDDIDRTRPVHEVARFRVRGAEPRKTGAPQRLSQPMVLLGEYREADWEAESFAVFAEGGDPCPCPQCGRTGFYAPRFIEPNLKVRACRFCGFYQQIGEPPRDMLPTVHGCRNWPEIAKAPYLWWVDPDSQAYECPFCAESVEVPLALVNVPYQDESHPWWKLPQGRSQSFYSRLWKNWEVTAGRVVL